MKIAFLQYDLRGRLGIMYLSAALKLSGHSTNVFTIYDKNVEQAILDYNPNILGLSSSTSEHKYLYLIAEKIKKINSKILIVLGGPHGTFFPEEIERKEVVDIVCRGEGDKTIVTFANKLEKGQSYDNIPNLWVKKEDKIIKNGMDKLIENLDNLPFPDRDVYYDKYLILKDNPTKVFILGRGCPFNCSYCFNHQMRNLYKGKGKYVRIPSVDYAIKQIKEVQDKYGFKWVQINDDTINYNKEWFIDFLYKFKTKINVPFICNVRIDLLDKDMAIQMIKAGVDRVNFGVECGDEEFRRIILRRNMFNKHIVEMSDIFRSHHVRLFTTNIIGFPGETLELAFKTIYLNRRIQPEEAIGNVLVPYPKTWIYDYCLSNGYLKENITIDNLPTPIAQYWSAERKICSVVKLEHENELLNIALLFHFIVKYKRLEWLFRLLIKLKPNRFYKFMSQIPIINKRVKYSKGTKERIMYIIGLYKLLFSKMT